jgi:hypothetical protein
MFIGNFSWEYLNPSTGAYDAIRLQPGDTSNIIRFGGGQVIRAQHDIHNVGRSRRRQSRKSTSSRDPPERPAALARPTPRRS